MYERILIDFRSKIRQKFYVISIHALEEMQNDGLQTIDLEECILGGKITERQIDRKTKEKKYRVNGKAVNGKGIEVIVKKGKLEKVIYITVYSI